MLAELAPNLVRVVAEISVSTGVKEELEAQLQDAFGAEFGDTVESLRTLESVHNALKVVTKRIE